MGDSKLEIQLTGDEALVFFEWISRFNERDDVTFAEQAEQRVLWDIQAMLEKVLVEPFDPNYDRLVSAARDSVRDEV